MQCSATQPATQQSLTLLVRLWQVTLVVKYDSTMEVRAEVLRSSLASAPCTRCFSRCISRWRVSSVGRIPLQDSGVHGFSCKLFFSFSLRGNSLFLSSSVSQDVVWAERNERKQVYSRRQVLLHTRIPPSLRCLCCA